MRAATLTELMDRLLDQDELIKNLRSTVRRQDTALGRIRTLTLDGQGIEKDRFLTRTLGEQDASLGG